MKNKLRKLMAIILAAFCCSFCLPAAGYAADTGTAASTASTTGSQSASITIQDAIDQACENSPSLKKAELTTRQAEITRDDAATAITSIPTGGLVSSTAQAVVSGYQSAEIAWNTDKKAEQTTRDGIAEQVVVAYATAVQDYNSLQATNLSIQSTQQQIKMMGVANLVGEVADYDYSTAQTAYKELTEQAKSYQSQYDGAIAALAALLGEDENWKPTLTSTSVMETYARDPLATEQSRALASSSDVYSAEAKLQIAQNQENWIISGTTSEEQSISTGLAEATYDQAKRDTTSEIQQLYYGIDALEGQITAAELADETAQKDLAMAQIKYNVGMIPYSSASSSTDNLYASQINAQKSKLTLASLKASLVQKKAQFAFLTGKTIYDAGDWSTATAATTGSAASADASAN